MCNKSHKTLYEKLCYDLKNKDDVTQFEELKNEIVKIVGNDKNKMLLLLAEAKEYTLFDGVSALCAFVTVIMIFANAYLSILCDTFAYKKMLNFALLIIAMICVMGVGVTAKKLYENYKYKYQVIEILTDMLENINDKEGI